MKYFKNITKLSMLVAFSAVLSFADTGMQVNEQVLHGGGTDVAMTKDRMAVVIPGGVDFYDMDYSNFQWNKVQTVGIPGAISVDMDGDFALVGAPSSVKNVDYLYAIAGNGSHDFLRYDVVNNSWSTMANLPEAAKYGAALAAVGNDIYAIVGGNSKNFYVYNVSNDQWSTVNKTNGTAVKYYYNHNFGVFGGGIKEVGANGGASLVYDGTHYLYGTFGIRDTTFFIFFSSNEYSNTFKRFDLENPDAGWVSFPQIPSSGGCAYGCALATDGTDIFMTEGSTSGFLSFIGGLDSKRILKYNISGGTWSTWATTPDDIGSGGAMTYRKGDGTVPDTLYVIAGKTGQFFAGDGSLINYSCPIGTATCTLHTNLPQKAAAGASIVFGGNDLFALRGTGTNTFMEYEFSIPSWIGNPPAATPVNIGPGGALVSQAFSKPDHVTLLRHNNTSNVWEHKTEYPLDNPQADLLDRFGFAVAVRDNGNGSAVGVVGAPNRSHMPENAGRGMVIQVNWNTSTPSVFPITLTTTVPGPARYKTFGSALDIKDGHVVIGDRNDSRAAIPGGTPVSFAAVGFVTNVAIEDNLVAVSADSENSIYSYAGTTETLIASKPVGVPGSVSLDQQIMMSTNPDTENTVRFWPLTNATIDPLLLTEVLLVTTPLNVATKSDFYKDMAVVNDTVNDQALALDVPCGLRPTYLKANVWTMISAPCGNNANDTGVGIDEIFGDDITGNYGDNGSWVMYKDGPNYTAKAADNIMLTASEAMELGRGYWIIADADVTLRANAGNGTAITKRTQLNTTLSTQEVAGNYKFALKDVSTSNVVKIMVGNPFPRTIKWSNVTENLSDPLGGVVDSTAYAYDATSTTGQPYRAITATPGFDGEIAPYQAVWIKQNIQSASAITINLPFEK